MTADQFYDMIKYDLDNISTKLKSKFTRLNSVKVIKKDNSGNFLARMLKGINANKKNENDLNELKIDTLEIKGFLRYTMIKAINSFRVSLQAIWESKTDNSYKIYDFPALHAQIQPKCVQKHA